jgi:hypothetical protein
MPRIILWGVALALLTGSIGCQSENYGSATKKAIKKMFDLELALKRIKLDDKDTVYSTKGEAMAVIAELEELHALREELPPFEPPERNKIIIKYGGPLSSITSRLDAKSRDLAASANPEAIEVGSAVQRVQKMYLPNPNVIWNDPRFQQFRPQPGGGVGGGSGGP